jgi:hypothetical protein
MINKKITFSVILFAACIVGLHYLINFFVLSQPLDIKVLLKINFFVTLLTIVVLNSLQVIKIKFSDKVGFGYLAFVLIKMIISVVFLFPFLKEKSENIKSIVLSFFIIFFIHLFFEAYSVIKSLKDDEKQF